MYPKFMIDSINEDFERRRDEEFQAMLRRPDAEPLPPEPEKGPGFGMRLSVAIRGGLLRLADALPHPRADDEAAAT
jgi:hypothetical protein